MSGKKEIQIPPSHLEEFLEIKKRILDYKKEYQNLVEKENYYLQKKMEYVVKELKLDGNKSWVFDLEKGVIIEGGEEKN